MVLRISGLGMAPCELIPLCEAPLTGLLELVIDHLDHDLIVPVAEGPRRDAPRDEIPRTENRDQEGIPFGNDRAGSQ